MPQTDALGPWGALLIHEDDDNVFRLPLISSGSTSRPAATTTERRYVNDELDPVQQFAQEAAPGTASFTYDKNATEAVQALYRLERANTSVLFEWVANKIVERAKGAASASLVAVATPTGDARESVATFSGTAPLNLLSTTLNVAGRVLVVDNKAFIVDRIISATTAGVYLVGDVTANKVTVPDVGGKISAAVTAGVFTLVSPAEVTKMLATVSAAGNTSISAGNPQEDTVELTLDSVSTREFWLAPSLNRTY